MDGLRLKVAPGERLAVLGPSEAGKSTLTLCLMGLIPRLVKGEWRGLIKVAGVDIHRLRPRALAGRVGVLFQDFEAQIFCTRVDVEVAFGPENLGLPGPELRRRVARALALVGLDGLEDRDPATLSGGQRQLLALAGALALEPKILLLDEPTTDLDPVRVEELLYRLDDLCRQQRLTMMLLGADVRLTRHCSRIVLLAGGRVAADGPAGEIMRQVELWRQLGLRPPALPALFHDLGCHTLPLTLAAAVVQARELGWHERRAEAGDNNPPPASGGAEIMRLREISFSYPNRPPLFQDLSISFREGELTAILGANGSGKTTLVKLLRGLLKPQAGEVWVAAGVRVGFVFQNPDYQLFAEQVWEEVAYGLKRLGWQEKPIEARVTEALARVHLLSRAQDDPFSLTKGQRQRLAVAAVLALAPQVIILDEPTTGLDHREQEDMLALIAELHARGHTIIMVTHSMWAATTYARRLVVLQDGQVVLDGPTREVVAQEEILARCYLKPPAVVQLSRRLGFLALTPQEFREKVHGRQD